MLATDVKAERADRSQGMRIGATPADARSGIRNIALSHWECCHRGNHHQREPPLPAPPLTPNKWRLPIQVAAG
jgi:hypothetical protein